MVNTASVTEWWDNAWWEKECYLEQLKCSRQEVYQAIDLLKTHFTSEWFKDIKFDPVQNVFLRDVFYGNGIHQLNFLVILARKLRALQGVPGLNSVLRRLRGGEGSDAAYFEINLAHILQDNGYSISFPTSNARGGKIPDILAELGTEKIALECKQLKVSQKERWLKEMYGEASRLLIDAVNNHGCAIRFEFEQYPLHRITNPEQGTASTVARSLVEAIIRQAAGALLLAKLPFAIAAPSIGKGLVDLKTSEATGTVVYPDMDQAALFNRLASNGIERAASQLAAARRPGIALLYSETALDVSFVSAKFNSLAKEDPTLYEYVSAVLIFTYQLWFAPYRPPTLITNDTAKFPFYDLPIAKVFKKDFDPIQAPSTSDSQNS